MAKNKASAASHAAERAQRENHLAETPPMTRSDKAADQGRAVAESPLQGEDRPVGKTGGKQAGPSRQAQAMPQTSDSGHQMPGTHNGKRNEQ